MTYENAVCALAALHKRGICPGLVRMENALRSAGNFHKRLKVIHVAGTNGKGSTARMIQCVLTAAGYRVGSFSSPVVTDIRNTVTIDGKSIGKRDFAGLVQRWTDRQKDLPDADKLTEFEFLTVLAMEYFHDAGVDVCVLECGMGGREDATNVCPPPLAAVLTPVAIDHAAFLGDTVEMITEQKCGIIKSPCRVISSPDQSPEALSVIYEQAAAKGLTVRQPNGGAAKLLACEPGKTTFRYDGETYTVPLGGAFQVGNALTAIEAVRAIADCGFSADADAIRQGLSQARLPCREEVIGRNPLILLDGAHNPHAIAALVSAVKAQVGDKPITLLIGMLRDKDTEQAAKLLAPLAGKIICCTPPCERAMEASDLADRFRAAGAADVAVIPAPGEAWDLAKQSIAPDGALIVCGSFYTAGAVRRMVNGKK